jgi:hypothetical protein
LFSNKTPVEKTGLLFIDAVLFQGTAEYGKGCYFFFAKDIVVDYHIGKWRKF